MDHSNNDDRSGDSTALIKRGPPGSEIPAPLMLRLGNTEENAAGAFSFSVLWQAFRQRGLLGSVLGSLLATAACVGLWRITEPVFRSAATLQIEDKRPHLVFQVEQSATFSHTQMELLRSRYLIGRAIEAHSLLELPELRELERTADPVGWIGSNLAVYRIGPSEFYSVSCRARYPTSAERIVRGIVETYLSFHSDESEKQRREILTLLKGEQKRKESDIELKRENMRKLLRGGAGDDTVALGIEGDDGKAMKIGASVMGFLHQKLIESELNMTLTGVHLQAATELAKKDELAPISEARIEAALYSHPKLATLIKEIEGSEMMMQAVTPGKTHHDQHKARLERHQQLLDKKKEELRPEVVKELEEQLKLERTEMIMQEQLNLVGQKKNVQLLQEMIRKEYERRTKQTDGSLDLEFARMELGRAEEVNRRLGDRALTMETEARAPSQVTILEKASVPQFPEGPSLMKKMIMLGTMAFFAPLALLIGWDVSFRRVFEREQLLREVDVKLVSEVAALPTRPLMSRNGSDKAFRQQALVFEESVNALRTTLSVDPKLEGHRVFVVASAISGEGKTNLSSQLAMSWSQTAPGKVIIIDADLRSPNIHELFEVEPRPGLAEVLRGECALEDAVVMDWSGRLLILPAGDTKSRSPSQLFSNANFRELVAKLKSHYYKVIIDVAPVLCAAETLQIAKEADGVLLCALRDYSRGGQVKEAYDRLAGAGVNIVGAVLNGTPLRQYAYAYRGYERT